MFSIHNIVFAAFTFIYSKSYFTRSLFLFNLRKCVVWVGEGLKDVRRIRGEKSSSKRWKRGFFKKWKKAEFIIIYTLKKAYCNTYSCGKNIFSPFLLPVLTQTSRCEIAILFFTSNFGVCVYEPFNAYWSFDSYMSIIFVLQWNQKGKCQFCCQFVEFFRINTFWLNLCFLLVSKNNT